MALWMVYIQELFFWLYIAFCGVCLGIYVGHRYMKPKEAELDFSIHLMALWMVYIQVPFFCLCVAFFGCLFGYLCRT